METTTNNNMGNNNQGNIMKELSDIKESLATNTAETKNIKESLAEVKADVKEMRNNYITQQQHQELVVCKNDHEIRLRDTEKNVTRILTWGSALVVLIGIIEFILNKYY